MKILIQASTYIEGKLSPQAQQMIKSRVGYRDDYLFGDGYHDTYEVAMYETAELGNLDILDCILTHYSTLLPEATYTLLSDSLPGCTDSFELLEKIDDEDEFEDLIDSALRAVIGNRTFCIWLCSEPSDIVDSYLAPYSDGRAAIYDLDNVDSYDIPEDAIILSDLGRDGCLWCWKE